MEWNDAGRATRRPAACRSITSRGRAGQSRPYPAVINTGMFLLPVRLGLHLWPFFNVCFRRKQPAGAVGLCGHACRSHLPLMTRGAAGTTCLRRRVAVRVRQAGSSGFPDPQQTGGHVVVVGKRNQSLVARTHARTGAAVGCCCAVAARLPLLIMTARWGL